MSVDDGFGDVETQTAATVPAPVTRICLGEHGIDIWGDTVNVASRLEAASEAGRVNISEATLTLLGNATTEERGTLPVKNTAPLRMFFVDQLI